MTDTDRIQIQVLLDRGLHEKLVLEAKKRERSLAAQTRFILTQWIITKEFDK